MWAVILGALAVVLVAVLVPVGLLVIRKKSGHVEEASSGGSAAGSTSGAGAGGGQPENPKSQANAITGGNGSMITTENGTTFMYVNNFGGYCEFFFCSAVVLPFFDVVCSLPHFELRSICDSCTDSYRIVGVFDINNPYNMGAKPNSWTPALNETFKYGVDQIFGCV